MTIRVCLAGATGWAGSALARAIAQTDDIELVAAVSRTSAKRVLGEVLNEPRLTCPIYATAQEALAIPCDVFFEYTKPDVAKDNLIAHSEGKSVHRLRQLSSPISGVNPHFAEVPTEARFHEAARRFIERRSTSL